MTMPKRLWLRFSLRTMFVAFTVIAVWLGWTSRLVHERRAVLKDHSRFWPTFVDTGAGSGGPTPTITWVRQIMGDRAVQEIWVSRRATDDDLQLATRLFPEADVSPFKFNFRGPSW